MIRVESPRRRQRARKNGQVRDRDESEIRAYKKAEGAAENAPAQTAAATGVLPLLGAPWNAARPDRHGRELRA